MSQGPLCPNLTKKFQEEVSQIANRNLSCVILLGGLSVNLNHLKMSQLDVHLLLFTKRSQLDLDLMSFTKRSQLDLDI